MKSILLKTVYSLVIAAIIIPVVGLAATVASIRAKRSDTYLMGSAVTGVPYYVYGYDTEISNAVVTVPVAPKLPIAGGGGKIILQNEQD